jgi:hypothetical protein
MPWYYNPHTGGKKIPPAVQAATRDRVVRYANQHHAGRFVRIDVRFRGALCYIDAYTDPGELHGRPPTGETREQWIERLKNTPHHLCRIRYFGNPDRWSFAFYTYAHEKYEPSFLLTGEDHGTPEEAFETCANFL